MIKFRGFTLIELIMVIVIVGILATMTTKIITSPVSSYLDLQRRTTLVDTAELALRRMQRDIRRALPNSVRITGGGTVLELLHVEDGGRYRARQDISAATGLCASTPVGDILDFTLADDCFEVTGSLKTFNPLATSSESLIIYNLGSVSMSLGIDPEGEHRAMADAVMTWKVFKRELAILKSEGLDSVADIAYIPGGRKRKPAALKVKDYRIKLIEEAIREERRLNIVYRSVWNDSVTKRVITPKEIRSGYDRSYVIAHCHLKNEERNFRVDGILEISPES
jgi:prepilin-type N-terminal cleavage/methylation domain-containing protein